MIVGNICVCIFDSVFCFFMVYLFLGWYISGAQLSRAQFATFFEEDSLAPDNWAGPGAQLSGAQYATFSGRTVGPRPNCLGPNCPGPNCPGAQFA